MQIDWWTLVLQAINFLILVWLLWRFLYRPVKEVIEKRRAEAEQVFADAASREGKADQARHQFEDAQAGLAEERQAMLKKIHEEQETERRKLIEQAKAEADKLLATARQSLEKERDTALADMRGQVAEMAADMAAGLLREAGTGVSNDVFLNKIEGMLAELPSEERTRLQTDLSAADARLSVVTALPLSADERDRWAERLGRSLDSAGKTDFTTEPGILGGAELRFPHAVLRYSWADQLSQARKMLEKNEAAE